MVCDYVKPSGFVQKNETVEVMFMENDVPRWYKGVVTDVNHRGKDAYEHYVECAVQYDDGEFVPDARFYDCDFNNPESTDSWRFPTSLTGVLTILDKTQKDILFLKKKQDLQEEEDPDEDEEEEEDEEDEEEKKSPKRSSSRPYFIGMSLFIIAGLFVKRAYLSYVLMQCMNQYTSVEDAIATINTFCFQNIKNM